MFYAVELGDLLPKRPRRTCSAAINFGESAHAAANPQRLRRLQDVYMAASCSSRGSVNRGDERARGFDFVFASNNMIFFSSTLHLQTA